MLFLIYKDILKIKERKENKMAEEWVDVEYISLHGYIRNTPAESGQEDLTSGK